MTTIEDQAELPLARSAQAASVPMETVRAQRTAAAAFTLACSVSGLEDKEIYLALGIDAGYFSNIKKGKATLQADLLARFCEMVGNAVYAEWMAYQVGCTLVMIKTEAERRAELAEQRAATAEAENKLMRQLLQGKAAA
jgi:plasmid maintenance system antidote protein VapI